jgi:gas vesicle protein
MGNKKMILGIAAGAAVLAGAAYVIARKRSNKRKFEAHVDEAKENFKGKLNELQRKARKEFGNTADDAAEMVNNAKERANDWVNKATRA